MYILLNESKYQITSLGKNKFFYYLTISNESNPDDYYDYNIDVSEIDQTKPELEQLYKWILTQPEFTDGTLISS
jgi:hypothetical protein